MDILVKLGRTQYAGKLTPLRVSVLLLVFVPFLLSACTPQNVAILAGLGQGVAQQGISAPTLSQRVGDEPMDVAEAYLRRYQPGPEPRLFQTTRVYDRNGALLAELYGEGRRTWVPLAKISPHLIQATIATEDATFYANTGIDPARIAGAALQNMREGAIVSGASTITMQLARMLFLPPDERFNQSVDRKALEAGLAQALTQLYTKDELLEIYLNLLNYGQLAYGPEAAAQVYFGKSAADLSPAEATLLAGIPQQPATLNPYADPAATRRRQRVVLDLLVRHGQLTQEEADAVFAQEIALAGDPGAKPARAPHFVQYLVDTIDAQYGDGFTQRAGWNIYTTLDGEMQRLAEEIVERKVAELQPAYALSNAALTAMQPGSGEILVMVGSVDFDDASIDGQVNVAVSPRQPGSAIKPVLYAAALDQDFISPASVIWDTPVRYQIADTGQQTDIYRPQNYDQRFHGPMTVRSALANSYNVPAVKLLDAFGVDRMLEQAHLMGVQSLDRGTEWYGLSLTLGGGEVTLLDLTTAYHTLANDGRYLPPMPVRLIADNLSRQIPFDSVRLPIQAVSPQTAYLVTDILSDNAARTPAFGADSLLRISRPAAVKTGTTSDWRDNWTVGYTRHLVAGVWAGNSDGRPMRNASGVTGAAPIWHAFMEAVLADSQMLARLGVEVDEAAWQFSLPSSIELRDECPPGLRCREGGELFAQSWLDKMGDAGPLGDSVADRPAAPVYAQDGEGVRLVGFCTMENAMGRTLVNLPGTLGARLTTSDPTTIANVVSIPADTSPAIDGAEIGKTAPGTPAEERTLALAWALRYGSRADLGPCEGLDAIAAAVLQAQPALRASGLRILIDVAAAGVPEVAAVPSSGAVEVTQFAGRAFPAASGTYALAQPVWHDANCPGQYIMGRVLDRNGAPVAGVRLQARDEWGNVYTAVSKSGAADYGMFDFPVASTTPHTIYVTVIDDAGNPISPSIVVEHQFGAGGNAPCHHLVVRGG